MSFLACLVLALGFAAPLAAQGTVLHYPEPPASAFTITRNVPYLRGDSADVVMDVYRPNTRSKNLPALIVYTNGAQRSNPIYANWARISAARGIVAILADLRPSSPGQDFRALLAHVATRGGDYGLDTAAIAVFGASSNGEALFALSQEPQETRIKAAIVYYSGSTWDAPLRRDLPLLIVRSGLDRPFVNAGLDSLIGRALSQNVPLTVYNYGYGHHGFEYTDDDVVTRALIDQTVEFVVRATSPAFRSSVARGVGYATAASHMFRKDYQAAATTYAELSARWPNDAMTKLAHADAVSAAGQFTQACDMYSNLKEKGLGPRDVGLPAARACLQAGDAVAAMAWLSWIPRQYLPVRVKDEAVFRPLQARADFLALFQR